MRASSRASWDARDLGHCRPPAANSALGGRLSTRSLPQACPEQRRRERLMRELCAANSEQPHPPARWRFLRRGANSLRFAELADLYRRAGALAEAAALCARGLVRYPNYATGHVVMGEIFYARQLVDKAREQWQEALRLDPQHPRAHYRLAELHLSDGEHQQAMAELESAVLCDPSFAEAQSLLAELQGQQPEQAVRAREQATAPEHTRGLPMPSVRFSELLDALQRSRFVSSAFISDANGLPLAGTPTWGSVSDTADPQVTAAVSAAVAQESRRLLACLRAGELRGVLLCSRAGAIRCLSLPGATLIAELDPDAPLGAADAEIAEAVARFTDRGGSDGKANGCLRAA